MRIEMVNDGHKNATVQASGILLPAMTGTFIDLFKFSGLNAAPYKVRIESITFAIQEKGGFNLYWTGDDDNILIMPLESRGFFDFEKVGCLSSPAEAKGICIAPFGLDKMKSFLLILDLGKQ